MNIIKGFFLSIFMILGLGLLPAQTLAMDLATEKELNESVKELNERIKEFNIKHKEELSVLLEKEEWEEKQLEKRVRTRKIVCCCFRGCPDDEEVSCGTIGYLMECWICCCPCAVIVGLGWWDPEYVGLGWWNPEFVEEEYSQYVERMREDTRKNMAQLHLKNAEKILPPVTNMPHKWDLPRSSLEQYEDRKKIWREEAKERKDKEWREK